MGCTGNLQKTSWALLDALHVGARVNIYLIGIASGEIFAWFAWVSDEHDHLMSIDGAAIRAFSRDDLDLAVAATGGALDWERESMFDVDSLMCSARSGVGVEPGNGHQFLKFP